MSQDPAQSWEGEISRKKAAANGTRRNLHEWPLSANPIVKMDMAHRFCPVISGMQGEPTNDEIRIHEKSRGILFRHSPKSFTPSRYR
jgi:hypothetical protein